MKIIKLGSRMMQLTAPIDEGMYFAAYVRLEHKTGKNIKSTREITSMTAGKGKQIQGIFGREHKAMEKVGERRGGKGAGQQDVGKDGGKISSKR